jgi:hypothetical protein
MPLLNVLGASLLRLVLDLTIMPVGGILAIGLGNPFSLTVLFYSIAALLAVLLGEGTRPDGKRAASGLFFGWLLSFLALRFSERGLPAPSTFAASTSGFPFHVFTYPIPPMGNDLPPIGDYAAFLLHHSFWMLIGYLFTILLFRQPSRFRFQPILVASGMYGLLALIGLVAFRFD